MITIFSNNMSVSPDPEAEGILIISGRGWENEPFELYIREEEAATLLWQLGFYVSNKEESND